MIKRRTLSKIFGGQVWNTVGVIFSTGEAHAPTVKQLKMPCLLSLTNQQHKGTEGNKYKNKYEKYKIYLNYKNNLTLKTHECLSTHTQPNM